MAWTSSGGSRSKNAVSVAGKRPHREVTCDSISPLVSSPINAAAAAAASIEVKQIQRLNVVAVVAFIWRTHLSSRHINHAYTSRPIVRAWYCTDADRREK